MEPIDESYWLANQYEQKLHQAELRRSGEEASTQERVPVGVTQVAVRVSTDQKQQAQQTECQDARNQIVQDKTPCNSLRKPAGVSCAVTNELSAPHGTRRPGSAHRAHRTVAPLSSEISYTRAPAQQQVCRICD